MNIVDRFWKRTSTPRKAQAIGQLFTEQRCRERFKEAVLEAFDMDAFDKKYSHLLAPAPWDSDRRILSVAYLEKFSEELDKFKGEYIEEQKRQAGKIPGGLADDAKPSEFDKAQLDKGIKVELEHTSDEAVAKEIAMDHLKEDSKYYDKLEKIHEE